MKLFKTTIGLILVFQLNGYAQIENSKLEIEQITVTLMKYIDGTANGEPDKLKEALCGYWMVWGTLCI